MYWKFSLRETPRPSTYNTSPYCSTDGDRNTSIVNPISILSKPKNVNSSFNKITQNKYSNKFSKPILTLHERQVAYYKKRDEIFNAPEQELSEESTNHQVPKIRLKSREKRNLFKAIDSTLLHDSEDDRVFLNVKIGEECVNGLVDSGANITCLGNGSLNFLKRNSFKLVPLNASLKTADGNSKDIIGYVDVPITFRKLSTNFTIFVAPDLKQSLYLGTNFIRYFQLAPDLFPPYHVSEISSQNENKHSLSESEEKLLTETISLFPSSEIHGLGKTKIETHVIETGNHLPIKSRHYPVSPAIQVLIDAEVNRMLSLGIIELSSSPWASPVTLVRKPNKNRLCLDFRKVNSVTTKLAYPIPNIDGILSRLSNTRFISAIDLKDAFWQIPLDPPSREKTAFVVPGRPLYHFTVMPFGLCNAPQRMMMLMDKVLPHELKESIFVYLDDLLVISPDFPTHIQQLRLVAQRLKDAGLTINVTKSNFCFKQVNYLGYIVGEGCLKTDPQKTDAISNYPIPKSKKQVRGFLGLAGWYRRFISNFASLAAPMSDTLKGDKFIFTEEALVSFQKLKEVLTSPPVLAQPDFSKKFSIQCDASDVGLGAVLFQENSEGNEQPIYFYSAKLTSAERNYSVTERECLAVVKAVQKFRPYVEGYEFDIITDHSSLTWLMKTKDLSGRLARWSLKLQPFSFSILHRKGSLNVVPDSLSRYAIVDSLYLESISLESDDICSFSVDFQDESFQSDEYKDLIEYIKENNEQLPDILVSEGLVYKRTNHTIGNDVIDTKVWKLWVPSPLRNDLMAAAHFPPNKSHGGVAKTLNRLRERFYWPYMAVDVKSFIKSCETCPKVKSPNEVLAPPLHGCFEVHRPFQHIFIDFLGPYPRTKLGNTKMFIVLDQLTKFVLLEPIRSSQHSTIIRYLKDRVFTVFGVPETVLSDNGSEFMSKTFKQFLEAYGVSLLPTPKYSPQANSSERVNRSIIEAIRCYITEHDHWDANISDICSALRTAVHQTIQTSPFEALFGQPMVQHGNDYKLLRKLDALNHSDIQVLSKKDHLQILQKYLMDKILKAHEKSAKTYNTRKRLISFQMDQEVFCRTFPQSNLKTCFVAKFSPRFQKARVKEVLGKNRYLLTNLSGKVLGVYHTKDMKPF